MRVTFEETALPSVAPTAILSSWTRPSKNWTKMDERKSKVVEMRFFGGLSVEETGDRSGCVRRNRDARDWKFSKSWLVRELRRER